MPAVAIAVSSYKTTDQTLLEDVLKDILPLLAKEDSSLDIVITEEIHSVDYLDYVLGKLYSGTREILLAEDLYDTPINVLFNQDSSHHLNNRWDLLVMDKGEVVHLPHKELKKVCLRKEIDKHERQDSTENDPLYTVSALGGTFDHLHDGHKILLSAAAFLTASRLIVGVTDQELLQKKQFRDQLESYETRSENVRLFLAMIKPSLEVEIVALRDICGPTGAVPEIESLIVSRETVSGGQIVNNARKSKGLKELKVHVVNVLGGKEEDGWKEKISSTELRRRRSIK
ncbi:LAQU0S05e07360g1_1 [Lachancea quebecensis]|uniref:LAQU0S05e07360g1_1 n=1 Tax=Lachancea quebecensis TaxID=1654605 RepID=A0A0P1KRL5_9SACH|nr:LAQU0S05e07360g1_1 [Lachancea quebecensis]